MSQESTPAIEKVCQYLGELFLKHRMSMEDSAIIIQQKDSLIEHLKAENIRLQRIQSQVKDEVRGPSTA